MEAMSVMGLVESYGGTIGFDPAGTPGGVGGDRTSVCVRVA